MKEQFYFNPRGLEGSVQGIGVAFVCLGFSPT